MAGVGEFLPYIGEGLGVVSRVIRLGLTVHTVAVVVYTGVVAAVHLGVVVNIHHRSHFLPLCHTTTTTTNSTCSNNTITATTTTEFLLQDRVKVFLVGPAAVFAGCWLLLLLLVTHVVGMGGHHLPPPPSTTSSNIRDS